MEDKEDSGGTAMDHALGLAGLVFMGVVIYAIVAFVWGLIKTLAGRNTDDTDKQN
jgi:hypothetical protein